MKKKHAVRLLLLLLLPVLSRAQGDSPVSSAEIHKTFPFHYGGRLVIRIDQGAKVEIGNGKGNMVNVTGFYQVKNGEDAALLNKCSLVVEYKGDSTVISSVCPADVKSADVHLKILLPVKADVDLAMGGGYLDINGITGQFTIAAYGGYYLFENLGGVLNATLYGGKVRVVNSTLDGSVTLAGGVIERENVKGSLTTSL